MEEQPKKRPRFQFSLLTAIVAMLAASGLLGLNIVPKHQDWSDDLYENSVTSYGWPLAAWVRHADHLPRSPFASPFRLDPIFESWSYSGLYADSLVGGVMVIVLAILCEALVRRHDRKRQMKQEGGK